MDSEQVSTLTYSRCNVFYKTDISIWENANDIDTDFPYRCPSLGTHVNNIQGNTQVLICTGQETTNVQIGERKLQQDGCK